MMSWAGRQWYTASINNLITLMEGELSHGSGMAV